MTKELLDWLKSVVMDPNAPHHQWPVYDAKLREMIAVLSDEPDCDHPDYITFGNGWKCISCGQKRPERTIGG